MAISFVAGNNGTTTINRPTAVDGDLLICVIDDEVTGATDFAWPTGWNELVDVVSGNQLHTGVAWFLWNTGDPTSWAAPSGTEGNAVAVYRGVNPLFPILSHNNAVATTDSTPSTPPLANTDPNAWWVAAFAQEDSLDRSWSSYDSGGVERAEANTTNVTAAIADSNGAITVATHQVTATLSGAPDASLAWLGVLRPDYPVTVMPVINPGFEDGFNDWEYGSSTWQISTVNPHSGTRCARLTNGQAGAGMRKLGIPKEEWPAAEGQMWTQRVWFRNESFTGAGGIRLSAYVNGAWTDAGQTEAQSIGATWTQQSVSMICPANTTKVAVRVAFAGSGVICMDDVELERRSPPGYTAERPTEDNLAVAYPVSNGGFESGLTGWAPINAAGDAAPAVDTVNPHNGAQSIKFVSAGGNSSILSDIQQDVIPGQQWAVGAWFRNTSYVGVGGLRMYARISGVWTPVSGTGISDGNADVQAVGTAWEYRRMNWYTVPSTVDALRARIAWGGGTGQINVDDVEFVQNRTSLWVTDDPATVEVQGSGLSALALGDNAEVQCRIGDVTPDRVYLGDTLVFESS